MNKAFHTREGHLDYFSLSLTMVAIARGGYVTLDNSKQFLNLMNDGLEGDD
jgi:hypothetical protein